MQQQHFDRRIIPCALGPDIEGTFCGVDWNQSDPACKNIVTVGIVEVIFFGSEGDLSFYN